MITWEDFSSAMIDILSSGYGVDLTGWHQDQLTNLLDKVDENDVGEFVNRFYEDVDFCDLMEGELNFVAELIGCKVNHKITFSK